jgi:hypothetical protein
MGILQLGVPLFFITLSSCGDAHLFGLEEKLEWKVEEGRDFQP